MRFTLLIILLTLYSCSNESTRVENDKQSMSVDVQVVKTKLENKAESINNIFLRHPEYLVDNIDFPVGKPNAKGYYNAQGFGINRHLGDDWNAVTGGNSDLGDPIYSIGNGYVSFAQNIGGGWGNVIRVIHQFVTGSQYESLYAHCDSIFINKGDFIKRGTQIGTIGTADGLYLAHLHLEVRDSIGMPIGGGYADQVDGYINPTEFINSHR